MLHVCLSHYSLIWDDSFSVLNVNMSNKAIYFTRWWLSFRYACMSISRNHSISLSSYQYRQDKTSSLLVFQLRGVIRTRNGTIPAHILGYGRQSYVLFLVPYTSNTISRNHSRNESFLFLYQTSLTSVVIRRQNSNFLVICRVDYRR